MSGDPCFYMRITLQKLSKIRIKIYAFSNNNLQGKLA